MDQFDDIWVANINSNNVTELDGANGSVVGTYSVGTNPYGIAVDQFDDIWVANVGSNNVTELDGANGSVVGTYNVGNRPESLGDMTGFALRYFVLQER